MMKRRLTSILLLACGLAASSAHAETKKLTLAEALKTARSKQPNIAAARANIAAAEARVHERLAPFLPQVNGNMSYSRQTMNSGSRGAALSQGTGSSGSSFDTENNFGAGLSLNQLVWDFGTTLGRYNAAKRDVESQQETEAAQLRTVLLGVRVAFFTVMADKALVQVAKDNLEAQERHLAQVEGFVTAGARPEIDLAQVRADVANAKLKLVNAQSAYESSKADLNQAMGMEQSTDYEVVDEELAPLQEEMSPEEDLVTLAVRARPELKALSKQLEVQAEQESSVKGGYWPNIGVSTGINDQGSDITDLTWNWNATATLSWPLFQGGATWYQVQELDATRAVTNAQLEGQRQQIRLEVVQARLQLAGAKAAVEAANQALESARETLRLAEARYQAGAGSIIEMQDAQLSVTNALGQTVQAAFNVSLARAQLMKALGKE